MAQFVVEVPDTLIPILRSAAAEAGFPSIPTTASGVKAMVVDFLKQKYREQRRLEAQRQVAPTVDTADSQARTESGGIA
jgi:hypothetical protein